MRRSDFRKLIDYLWLNIFNLRNFRKTNAIRTHIENGIEEVMYKAPQL